MASERMFGRVGLMIATNFFNRREHQVWRLFENVPFGAFSRNQIIPFRFGTFGIRVKFFKLLIISSLSSVRISAIGKYLIPLFAILLMGMLMNVLLLNG